MYRIVREDNKDLLADLHKVIFADTAPMPYFEGYWWVVLYNNEAVAFAGVRESPLYENCGYYDRVGVLPEHRGNKLMNRLTRTLERKARSLGWTSIVTDTTDNPASANNLIDCGYRTFFPDMQWSFRYSIYWRKVLNK